MHLVVCAVAVWAAGVVDDAKVAQARADCRAIDMAVKRYYIKNGEWPATLDDVVGLLDGGRKVLTDPWGKAYRFEIRVASDPVDGTQIERPYIWTRRVVTKTEVYDGKR